jgi:shikimate kinase
LVVSSVEFSFIRQIYLMKVFLVGYMASGKSSKGPALARNLGLPFVDLDEEIARREGMSISALFKSRGEAGFRRIEHQYLLEYGLRTAGFVMATGGGTPSYFDHMALMNHWGVTVYLKVEENILVGRLKADRARRPLISELSESELVPFIRSHLHLREPRYEESQLVWTEDTEMDRVLDGLKSLSGGGH